MTETYTRPTGSLGRLYDRIATYSTDPVGEIERLANEALSSGVLNDRWHFVVQHRLPFHGFQREDFKNVGMMLGKSDSRAHQIENRASERLGRYLLREEGKKVRETNREEYLGLSLDCLPWDESRPSRFAQNGLKWELGDSGTIRDVLGLLEELAQQGRPLASIRHIGKQAGEKICQVVQDAGIELPPVSVFRYRYGT